MLFNSFSYLIFLPIVFIIYWAINNNLKLQNLFLLFASYFFYAFWDYRFLFLLVFSTFLDFISGKLIFRSKNQIEKKSWLLISVIINLGFLGVFKYFNFFTESFSELFSNFGIKINPFTLKLILPVGISFYTFHGLSYVIDIYKNRFKPINDFVSYSVFVCFFPLLVAGPIERATHLLPQITTKRVIDYNSFVDGLRQILWGLVKKIIIADSCASYVNMIFGNYSYYNGSSLFLGAILFAIQIYGDFSGYSDIALGSAKLFGINLLRNFSYPYFSRDIAEFWRKWHMSLSSWFRDYVYIPLGGSKSELIIKIRNTFIIFLLSGFWHGANWTFIFWGLINAIYFLPLLLLNKNRNYSDIVATGRVFPTFKEFFQILSTFFLTTFAWIFFRSNNIHSAFEYISKIFSNTFFEKPINIDLKLSIAIFIFLVLEWFGREHIHPLQIFVKRSPKFIRWSIYYILILGLYLFRGTEQTFIYFSF
jgi:D-alanyl-lipoteichoic acid acyltransferase DltB (MBOAT superfamily)